MWIVSWPLLNMHFKIRYFKISKTQLSPPYSQIYYMWFWPSMVKIFFFKKSKQISKTKILNLLQHFTAQQMGRSAQSVPCHHQWCLSHCVSCPYFVKISLPKSKVKVNVLYLSNKVKLWDLLKGSMSLVKVALRYGNNESDTHRTYSTQLCAAWVCTVNPQYRSLWGHRAADNERLLL
jgi:hypothetical protein